MKHTLLTFSLLLTAFVGLNAQARLGSSLEDIRSEYSESIYNLSLDRDKNGALIASIDTPKAFVVYHFDESNICDATMIFPNNQGALNFYVELYNEQYVIISDTKWKMYSAGGMSNVELRFLEDGYYFLWTN